MTEPDAYFPMPAGAIDAAYFPNFEAIFDAVVAAQTIALCAHTKPDGDAFGSVLAMAAIIRNIFPEKKVFCLLADDEKPSATFDFLKPDTVFLTPAAFKETILRKGQVPDLFVALDTPLLKRLGHAARIAESAEKRITIDHHLSREPFSAHTFIDEGAPATGYLIGMWGFYLEQKLSRTIIDAEIANHLFLALMTDTGRFQYQNTNAQCLGLAASLVARGANPAYLSAAVYQNEPLNIVHLKALVAQRICTYLDGKLAFSYACLEDFATYQVRPTDADGLVDVVRGIEGAEVALFLKETSDGITVRGNLRAKGDCDVASIAEQFGGGGHRAAAGFSAKGSIEEIKAHVIELARDALSNAPAR